MKNDIYIAIDLELEQPKSNPQTPDSLIDYEHVIQLGCVVFKLNLDGEPGIIHSESYIIHYPHKLSSFIEKLTGVTTEEVNESGLTLEEAVVNLKALRERFGSNRILVQWGFGDYESHIKPIDRCFGNSSFNVKHMFKQWATANGLNDSGGLSKALNKVGLQFKPYGGKSKHDAVADAYNTARIFNQLMKNFSKPSL